MKSNSCIYLIAPYPVFNINEVPEFDGFSKKETSTLYSALLNNHRRNFISPQKNNQIIYYFDERDKDYIPEIFNGLSLIQFYNCRDNETSLRQMAEKYFNNYLNNLIVFGRSIGFTSGEINRAFDLLTINDEALVLGKCINDAVAFLGFNSYNQEIFDSVNCSFNSFDKILAEVNKHDNFIHVMGNYQYIKEIEDFKKLYTELSKKESWSYCNQEMHEQFTHLFIEYKELLK